MRECCFTTRKGTPCTIPADRSSNGVWYCHVHDPGGVFQANQRGLPRPERPAPPPEPKIRMPKMQPLVDLPEGECPFDLDYEPEYE